MTERLSVSSKNRCTYPLRLAPVFQERVWGQLADCQALSTLYPARPAAQRIGEVWLTGSGSTVENGVWAGVTLGQLAAACGEDLLGTSAEAHPSGASTFPLLIKFLFTADKLSVQVHPTDAYAAERESSWGKTEMWHILSAAPDARLAIGFRRDAAPPEPQTLHRAITSGEIEKMLDWVQPRAGETYFVPAGAVHAIGGGLVLCEVQQNSDVTYRLFDYHRHGTDGRPRALHLEDGLAVLSNTAEYGRTRPLALPEEVGAEARLLLAACPYFATERWELSAPVSCAPRKGVEIWVALQGAAEALAGREAFTFQSGEAIVVPAGTPACRIQPQGHAVLLRVYRPDLEQDIAAPLRAAGASSEDLRKVCFPMGRGK